MFDRFSERARRAVVYAADAAREHRHDAIGTEHLLAGILVAGGPAAAALNSWGVTASALDDTLGAVSDADPAPAPATGHIPFTSTTKNVLAGALRQTSLLGHEEIDTEHLLLALLIDVDSPGVRALTELSSLSVEEMRAHVRDDLNHPPGPGPVYRVLVRLSDDEYTRAQAAAHAAGRDLDSWIQQRIIDALDQLDQQ